MRVLIAHASSVTRRRLGRPLRMAGHHVREAGGTSAAQSACRASPPDVLLLSEALCARDGVPLLDVVKRDISAFRTAVVLMAPADWSGEHAADALRRGVEDVLLEPVREAELLARVQAAGRVKCLQEEIVAQARRLEGQLFSDPLTRVYNRRFLFSRLDALVSGARRHGRPLAVAMVDLDGFKEINDRHGHRTGDHVLVATARALEGSLRAEDVLGRIGGEEFLVLLPDSDEVAAQSVALRLRLAVAGARGPVPVTASVGWTSLHPDDKGDDIVGRADEALYAAKAAGRNRVRAAASLPRRT